MKFKVGPWSYTVKISPKPIQDHLGRMCDGLCDWSNRTIWLYEGLPLEQRAEVLYHELDHAWQRHFGTPSDAEGSANRNSSFAADVQGQLERQGGLAALARMCAGMIVDGADAETPSMAYKATCKGCSGDIAIGDIHNSVPQFDPGERCLVIGRCFFCEFCQHTQTWNEACTATGRPTGRVIGQPKIYRGNLVNAEAH